MVDFNSPLEYWDILLPHAVITLNILHSSLIHPCQHMHPFLVTSTQSSTSCTTRNKSGGPHSSWQMPFTCSTQQSELVYRTFTKALPLPPHLLSWHHGRMWVAKSQFFPRKTPFPSVSAMYYLTQTAADMLFLLKIKKPCNFTSTFWPTNSECFWRGCRYTRLCHSNATSIQNRPPSSISKVVVHTCPSS